MGRPRSSRGLVAARASLIILLVVTTGCGTGGRPSSAGSASPAAATPAATAATATAPSPDSEPPVAELRGVAGETPAGDLGTFSWDGFASDSPWIVGATSAAVHAGATLTVAFMPPVAQATWQARWAPLTDNRIGAPADGGSGTSGAIVIAPPRTAGSWSLQLTARFGQGRSATWYWRVEVAA